MAQGLTPDSGCESPVLCVAVSMEWGCAAGVSLCGVAFFCASPAEWIEGDVTGAVVSEV